MQARNICYIAEETVLRQEAADIRIVEARLCVDKPGLFILLMPCKRKLVGAGANPFPLIPPRIVENALPRTPTPIG